MRRRIAKVAAMMVSAGAIGLVASSGAAAAFPQFSDCPLRGSDLGTCVDIQSREGTFINIKGFNVPLHDTLRIRGGVRFNEDGTNTFVAPAGTNGFFGAAVRVPGGLLGVDLPFGFNTVTAQAQLAGAPSAIRLDLINLGISVPVKLKLTNTFFSSTCYIGSNSSPATLNLITGTTSPPAPNRPITGSVGTVTFPSGYTLVRGSHNVDNSFSIPKANGCGLFSGGLIDTLVNAKLKLPSAAGNNTTDVVNDLALQSPQ